MADCECLPFCPFFNNRMANMPAMANLMKQNYCQDDFRACARYLVIKALGPAGVPADLFPNMAAEARSLIKDC